MKIVFSLAARQDLYDIFEYIANTLQASDTAAKVTRKIVHEIRSLEFMPETYPIYKKDPWHSQKVRFFPVKNYLIFYVVNKEESTISIIRILYRGRNISNLIKILIHKS